MTESTTVMEQVFLMERDTGVLCRVLGLYAARGVEVVHVAYEHAAVKTMLLRVRVEVRAATDHEVIEILLAKAGVMVGVVEAAWRHGHGMPQTMNLGGREVRQA